MLIVDNNEALRDNLAECRSRNQTIGLVPTMGNLHAGHIALVKKAQALADVVVVSIFVNPMQFGQNEDFNTYPRTLGTDSLALCNVKTDYLYAPTSDQLYLNNNQQALAEQQTTVYVPGLSEQLCGEFRPGHFQGVTTIVAKLFNLVQPDVAVFGEKDFQQLLVIKRMVSDLNYAIKIVGVATIREKNGLAMSSRNQYLQAGEREQAAELYRTLLRVQERIERGNRNYQVLEKMAMQELRDVGFQPEYVAIRASSNLSLPEVHTTDLVILVAAYLGNARLIDNLRLIIDL